MSQAAHDDGIELIPLATASVAGGDAVRAVGKGRLVDGCIVYEAYEVQ